MASAHYNALNHLLKLAGVDAEGHKSGAQIDMVISVDYPTGDIYLASKAYPDSLVVLHPDGTAERTNKGEKDEEFGTDFWTNIRAD